MKKIRLSLDDLVVNSFDVLPEAAGASGTVQGNAITTPWTICYSECTECTNCGSWEVSACYTRCPSCDTGCMTCPPPC